MNNNTIINDFTELLKIQDKQLYSEFPTKQTYDESEKQYKRDILKDYKYPQKNEQFLQVFESSEYIPLKKVITLKRLLSYLKFKHGKELREESYVRLNRNLTVLNFILNSTKERGYAFPDKDPLCIKKSSVYGYTKGFEHGRLYSLSVSITQLSREFRFLIFEGLYHDIDIVNAHPSILYNYSKEKRLKCEALIKLVQNRTEFYADVKSEYKMVIGEEFTKKLNVKKLTLAVLNSHKTNYKSKTLANLARDMLSIRQHLKNDFYVENSSFKSAIDVRMSETTELYKENLLSKIQSLYCFDKETETILAFKDHYEKKVGFSDSIVPFFDGLFILKDEFQFDHNTFQLRPKNYLPKVIESFNKNSKLKLIEKTIESDYNLLTSSSLSRFELLIEKLKNLSRSDMQKLITSSDVLPQNAFEDIIQKDFDKQEKDMKFLDISFSYETLCDLKSKAQYLENRFIEFNFKDEEPFINPQCLSSRSTYK